ncbi:MAG: 16S rRNA (guanine(966)-N(2))-methyltransferase RsmD [Bryobacter sp.]|jgi:16S rRNA (guanine966-N2)-methyltransferase|nr:16S rRNA (guanine(966)-N(2))-methyltransferase RsmD [Bryobacter sp. CoA8 C33]
MRVIGGEFASRKLVAPKGQHTRPTPDRLRESLFSILAPRLEQQPFADLYCGSGAVGIEALSRGARHCLFVENDKAALDALRQNLAALKLESRCRVIPRSVRSLLDAQRWEGIVFVDPPYDQEEDYEACLAVLGQQAPNLLLLQHDRRLKLPETAGRLVRFRQLKQGDNWVSFYGRGEA